MASNDPEITENIAKGLNLDAYCWCVAFANLLNIKLATAGIDEQAHTVNSQIFMHKCLAEIKSNEYIDNYTKRLYRDDLSALITLLSFNSKYNFNRDNPEHGRSTLSPKNIQRRTLLKFLMAMVGSIVSLGTNTHIWPGSKKEDIGTGRVSAATGLASSIVRWGLGAGFTAFLVLSAPWALALYIPFCIFRVFYKEWDSITDSEFKNYNGEAVFSLYKLNDIKNKFSTGLNNEYINQRNKVFGFIPRGIGSKRKMPLQNTLKMALLNMFNAITTPIKTFSNERDKKTSLANKEKEFAIGLANLKLPSVAEAKPTVDPELQLMWQQIYTNCVAFARLLGVSPAEIFINEKNKSIDKVNFEVACERLIKENKDMTQAIKMLHNADLKILLDRIDSYSEYSVNKSNPDFGKSLAPQIQIYAMAGLRFTLACVSSIFTAGGDTHHYPGAKKYKQRMGDFGAGIKLFTSIKSFLLGIGVLAAGVTAPPIIAVGVAYCVFMAYNNEWQPIMDKVYQDFHGVAAMAKMRDARLVEQLSPDLQLESANILRSQDKNHAKLDDTPPKKPFFYSALKMADQVTKNIFAKLPIDGKNKTGKKPPREPKITSKNKNKRSP